MDESLIPKVDIAHREGVKAEKMGRWKSCGQTGQSRIKQFAFGIAMNYINAIPMFHSCSSPYMVAHQL